MTNYSYTDSQLKLMNRKDELLKRSEHRLRLLKEMEAALAAGADFAPTEIEVEATLAIGRMESAWQTKIARNIFHNYCVEFNIEPWWSRLWWAWKKRIGKPIRALR